MLTTVDLDSPVADHGALALAAARALGPELRTRAAEGETGRTMPSDVAERVRAAGLFGLSLPRTLGGSELDPLAQMRVIEELSRADGSAGWTVLIGNSSMIFAWLDPAVAREMIGGDSRFASATTIGPVGRAEPDGAACVHGERTVVVQQWLPTRILVTGRSSRDRPRCSPHRRRPRPGLAAGFPACGGQDRARHLGLVGVARNRQSRHHRRQPQRACRARLRPVLRTGPPRRPAVADPVFHNARRLSRGLSLGVARRALDEFLALAVAKRRGSATQSVAETGDAQIAVARAEGVLAAAKAFVIDALGTLWDTACAGDPPTVELRARVQLATLNAQRAAETAIDAVMPFAGAAGVYSSQPLQRCFRDIHTAGQHIFFSADAWKRCARLRLGIDQPTFMI